MRRRLIVFAGGLAAVPAARWLAALRGAGPDDELFVRIQPGMTVEGVSATFGYPPSGGVPEAGVWQWVRGPGRTSNGPIRPVWPGLPREPPVPAVTPRSSVDGMGGCVRKGRGDSV